MKKSIIIFLLVLFAAPRFIYSQDVDAKNLSHYIFPEFRKGTIKFKNLQVQEMMLNYNSVTEEMIFDSNGKKLAIADPASIDTITIENRKFISGNNIFYEVAGNYPVPLLIHHVCNLIPPGKDVGYGATSQTSAVTSINSLMGKGTIYELKLPDDYRLSPASEFLIKLNNNFYRVYNANTVSKYFPDKKDAIKVFLKNNKISFKKTEDMKKLIEFCNK
jgi:hypothetical protein